jgi:hypothetical protein
MKSGLLKTVGTSIFTLTKVLVIIGLAFYLFIRWLFGPVYQTEDLIRNYEKHEKEILEVKDYFTSILPPDTYVDIEFEGKHPDIFHVRLPGKTFESNWNLRLNSPKTDSLLIKLNWSQEVLRTLCKKLRKAECISVSGEDDIKIGWQRSLMSKYYYRLFDENLNQDQIKLYSDSCIYQIYKPKVVLEYGSGAIGSLCFPEFRKDPYPKEKKS